MDVYHTGKEDRDDHRIVRERLLDVAIPPPSADGSVIRLEDCLEQYFNNKIEVKRHLQRRNTVQSFRPNEKEMGVETLELAPESPMEQLDPLVMPSPSRPVDLARRRGQSIFGQRPPENGEEEKRAHDDIGLRGNRSRAGTIRREVLMPAWQFFSLIRELNNTSETNYTLTRSSLVHTRSPQESKERRTGRRAFTNKATRSWHMSETILHDQCWGWVPPGHLYRHSA
jgi:hypothetical protein